MKRVILVLCLLITSRMAISQTCVGGFINTYRIDTIWAGTYDTSWNGGLYPTGDGGPANVATCYDCDFLTTDYLGNTYVVDRYGPYGNPIIRKINAAGIISKFAGIDSGGTFISGGAAMSQKIDGTIAGLSGSSSGKIYYSESGYSTGDGMIKKISGGTISKIAGCSSCSSNIFGSTLATNWKLADVRGIYATGGDGVILCDAGSYSATFGNGYVGFIYPVDGIMYLIAGGGASTPPFGDGDTTVLFDGTQRAYLSKPSFVTADFNGNLYVIDGSVIRKIDTNNIITKFAGSYDPSGYDLSGYTGDGGPASNCRLNNPTSMVFDPSGNAYIADFGNNVIRKINTAGVITTYIGNSSPSSCTGFGKYFNCPLNSFALCKPVSITINSSTWDQLYFDDVGSVGNAVFKTMTCTTSTTSVINTESESTIFLYPNPVKNELIVESAAEIHFITITDILGKNIYNTSCDNTHVVIPVVDLPSGVYFVRINNTEVRKFVKE